MLRDFHNARDNYLSIHLITIVILILNIVNVFLHGIEFKWYLLIFHVVSLLLLLLFLFNININSVKKNQRVNHYIIYIMVINTLITYIVYGYLGYKSIKVLPFLNDIVFLTLIISSFFVIYVTSKYFRNKRDMIYIARLGVNSLYIIGVILFINLMQVESVDFKLYLILTVSTINVIYSFMHVKKGAF